jgi:NADH:ubiquinone oxidoreductase subunit 2 (subunit N)
MVSAAIAAFFYLRVAVTMYSPVGEVADPVDATDVGSAPPPPPPNGASAGTVTDGVASLQVLTDAPPSDWVTERGVVFVPTLTRVAIGITVAFTVVFGIIPEPILDFAHQATLLFT